VWRRVRKSRQKEAAGAADRTSGFVLTGNSAERVIDIPAEMNMEKKGKRGIEA